MDCCFSKAHLLLSFSAYSYLYSTQFAFFSLYSLKDFIDDSDDFFLDLKVKKSTTKSGKQSSIIKKMIRCFTVLWVFLSFKGFILCLDRGKSPKSSPQDFKLFLLNCSTERSSDPEKADDSWKEKHLLPRTAVSRHFK